MANFCTNCGRSIEGAGAFCKYCGAPLNAPAPAAEPAAPAQPQPRQTQWQQPPQPQWTPPAAPAQPQPWTPPRAGENGWTAAPVSVGGAAQSGGGWNAVRSAAFSPAAAVTDAVEDLSLIHI